MLSFLKLWPAKINKELLKGMTKAATDLVLTRVEKLWLLVQTSCSAGCASLSFDFVKQVEGLPQKNLLIQDFLWVEAAVGSSCTHSGI